MSIRRTWSWGGVFGAACGVFVLLALGPAIGIRHPRPRPVVDTAPFAAAGCAVDRQDDQRWVCTEESPLSQFGCDYLSPDGLLAGLTPSYPAMWCAHNPTRAGPIVMWQVDLILSKDGGFVRLDHDEATLRRTFAPISSPEEALSYAHAFRRQLAVKDDPPRLAFSGFFGIHLAHATRVERTRDGYVVNLFGQSQDRNVRSRSCYRYENEVRVHVAADGRVRLDEPVAVARTRGCVVY